MEKRQRRLEEQERKMAVQAAERKMHAVQIASKHEQILEDKITAYMQNMERVYAQAEEARKKKEELMF